LPSISAHPISGVFSASWLTNIPILSFQIHEQLHHVPKPQVVDKSVGKQQTRPEDPRNPSRDRNRNRNRNKQTQDSKLLAGISFAWIALRGAVGVSYTRLPAKKKVTTETRFPRFCNESQSYKFTPNSSLSARFNVLPLSGLRLQSTVFSLQSFFGASVSPCVPL